MPFSRLRVGWREYRKMEEEGAINAWRNRQGKKGRWGLTGSSLLWEGGHRVGGGIVAVYRHGI